MFRTDVAVIYERIILDLQHILIQLLTEAISHCVHTFSLSYVYIFTTESQDRTIGQITWSN